MISAEPALAGDAVAKGETRKVAGMRWWQPVVGGAIAAGVAAMSVLWIRAEAPVGESTLVADNAGRECRGRHARSAVADNSAPESYVVPASCGANPHRAVG